MPKSINQKCQNCHVENVHTDVPVLIIELLCFLKVTYLTAKGIIPESLKSIGQFSHTLFNYFI